MTGTGVAVSTAKYKLCDTLVIRFLGKVSRVSCILLPLI